MHTGLQYSFVLCGYHSRRPGLRHSLLSRVPIGSTATWFEWTLNSFMRWLVNKTPHWPTVREGTSDFETSPPSFAELRLTFCVCSMQIVHPTDIPFRPPGGVKQNEQSWPKHRG